MIYSIQTAPVLRDPFAITYWLDTDDLTEMVADVLRDLPQCEKMSTSRLALALKQKHGRALPPTDALTFDLTRLARTVRRPVAAFADGAAIIWSYEWEWRAHAANRGI